MQETLEAIYENGIFTPLTVPNIPEGQKVKVIIAKTSSSAVDELLDLAGKVYEGLSEQEVDEVEKMALNRKHFFDRD